MTAINSNQNKKQNKKEEQIKRKKQKENIKSKQRRKRKTEKNRKETRQRAIHKNPNQELFSNFRLFWIVLPSRSIERRFCPGRTVRRICWC